MLLSLKYKFALLLLLLTSGIPEVARAQATTPNIGLYVPGHNSAQWDIPLNQNFNLLDQYLAAVRPLPALQTTTWMAPGAVPVATLVGYINVPIGAIASVIDAGSSSTCTTGGGGTFNFCINTPIGWMPLSSTGGSGGCCTTLPNLTVNGHSAFGLGAIIDTSPSWGTPGIPGPGIPGKVSGKTRPPSGNGPWPTTIMMNEHLAGDFSNYLEVSSIVSQNSYTFATQYNQAAEIALYPVLTASTSTGPNFFAGIDSEPTDMSSGTGNGPTAAYLFSIVNRTVSDPDPTNYVQGIFAGVYNQGAAAIPNAVGVGANFGSSNHTRGPITNGYLFYSEPWMRSAVSKLYGYFADLTNTPGNDADGAIGTYYAYYVGASPNFIGTVTNRYVFVSEAGSGNFGINTITPTHALEVVGDAQVTGNLTFTGTCTGCYLKGTTASIGGVSLASGACATGTATVTGVTTSMGLLATPAAYPGNDFSVLPYVSATNTVTVSICNLTTGPATPVASVYNVRALP